MGVPLTESSSTMARTATRTDLSIARLESLLRDRQGQIAELLRDRQRLQASLDRLDDKIKALGGAGKGTGPTTPSGRPHNAKGLVETLVEVMANAGGRPMGVGEILQGVLHAGYRSTATNFRGLINQTLIKERAVFFNVGRGIYSLKAAGSAPSPVRRGRGRPRKSKAASAAGVTHP